jgi:limonene-1,2-epoxide hydrolase
MHPFRAAVEAKDFETVPALLAEDVTFLSPVAFRPYQGRELVGAILRGVGRVFTDITYVRELADAEGLALVFTARIDDRNVHGCDFLRFDSEGLITEFCVMLRPLSATQAMAERMGAQFEAIKADAAARIAG